MSSASDAIERVRKRAYEQGYEQGKADALQWIPVSERLPEEYSRCLVTVKMYGGFRDVRLCTYGRPIYSFTETHGACFYETDSEWGDFEIGGVIAWMPQPESYEESEVDDAEIH